MSRSEDVENKTLWETLNNPQKCKREVSLEIQEVKNFFFLRQVSLCSLGWSHYVVWAGLKLTV